MRDIECGLYVNDLTIRVPTVAKAEKLKGEAIEIFEDAKFKLHNGQ